MSAVARAGLALAAVLLSLLTLGASSSAPAAADNSDCQREPDSLICQQQAADQACATYGPESNECLSARNVYLEHRVQRSESLLEYVAAQLRQALTAHAQYVDKMERKVSRQARTIERLRDRLEGR